MIEANFPIPVDATIRSLAYQLQEAQGSERGVRSTHPPTLVQLNVFAAFGPFFHFLSFNVVAPAKAVIILIPKI